ncbi:MAG: sulfite exporter TauE/SafE family protein [Candidatus Omnitrophica bacterium]|nr:sulfite exporter TauE/SafE family protein [Candidatus Omnitrophota bacterium]MBU1870347.1 sulfite exporter TauE/SafE family protein [Candidatus Omnitrophota bacterium]
MVNQILFVVLGLTAGVLSGLFGIGGGMILVPALVFLFGLTQLQAQGTTLAAMVPPIGLLAAWRYWQSGNVKLGTAGFICLGFFIGGLVGASFIQGANELWLRRAFGCLLGIVAIKMIIGK